MSRRAPRPMSVIVGCTDGVICDVQVQGVVRGRIPCQRI